MTTEPRALTWVVHAALGRHPELPPNEEWRAGLPALRASRLSSLAAHLVRLHAVNLPRDIQAHLGAASLLATRVAEQRRRQLDELSEPLNRSGVEWLVLKGWPLARRLYPSPVCRPSGDLDLLVSAGGRRAALSVLEAAGYRAEGDDRSYHTRLVRDLPGQGISVIELHHRTMPPEMDGPDAATVLARRRQFDADGGVLWIASPADELDLLVRHYLRHAGNQAILLLDVARLLNGESVRHPLGSLLGDDFERLGLGRVIDGPNRRRHAVLRRWMARRTFEERRAARHAALVGIPLALARSPVACIPALVRVLWPARPTPRWVVPSRTGAGRFTWRFRRLARFGR